MNGVTTRVVLCATALTVATGLAGQSFADAQGGGPKAHASSAKGRTFSGKTKQGKTIKFKVAKSGRYAAISKLGYRTACVDKKKKKIRGESGVLTRAPHIAIKRGKLRYSRDLFAFAGKFTSSKRASGTFRVTFRNAGGGHCTSHSVRWSARAR
jgi:hypothetical protein